MTADKYLRTQHPNLIFTSMYICWNIYIYAYTKDASTSISV